MSKWVEQLQANGIFSYTDILINSLTILATESTEDTEKEKVRHGLTQINTDMEIIYLADKITRKSIDMAFKNDD